MVPFNFVAFVVYCKKHLPEEQEHDKDYGNGLPPVEPEDQIHEDAKIV